MSSTSTDDLFASLGGSLMKDLWADLQIDGDDDGVALSLEQLERELAYLDDDEPTTTMTTSMFPSTTSAYTPPGLSAASLVVSHQNDMTTPMFGTQQPNLDAWSKSLEKFTATSLEKDFLAADSARKQTRTAPPGFMSDVENYDVSEEVLLTPPPGLSQSKPPGFHGGPQGSLAELRVPPTPNTSLSELPSFPLPPKTPNNSMAHIPDDDDDGLPKFPTKTPQNSLAVLPEGDLSLLDALKGEEKPTAPYTPANSMAHIPEPTKEKPVPYTPANSMAQITEDSVAQSGILPSMPRPAPPTPHNSIVIPSGVSPLSQQQQQQQQQSPTTILQGVVASPGMAVPVAMPVMVKPPVAWQQSPPKKQQPQTPPQPQVPVYCDAHPAASPIHSNSLQSSLMKPRDIAYVVHSILKPILLMGSSPSDYQVRFLARRGATEAGGNATPSSKQNLQDETASRQKKTMEWMKDKGTLGHVSKTDVTRPRALLASPALMVSEEDMEQKQRASLWKARLHIDQGYQAANALVEIWQQASPGTVPPEVQQHLVKLFKCLGMTVKDGVYSMDDTKDSLRVVLKMSKGRTFVARLLEQALLPPGAVQALIPVALGLALETATDDRLFSAMGRVVATLPNLEPATVVAAVKAAQTKRVLTSQARMECVHALLRRGNALAQNNPTFYPEWQQIEGEFMKLLE